MHISSKARKAARYLEAMNRAAEKPIVRVSKKEIPIKEFLAAAKDKMAEARATVDAFVAQTDANLVGRTALWNKTRGTKPAPGVKVAKHEPRHDRGAFYNRALRLL